MFTYTDETRTIWFNPHSLESALEFELIGILLGVAIYNSIILDVRFPLTVYKKVKDMTLTLDDLSEAQPTIARSLKAMRDYEGDVESTFCATFQVRCRVLFARHRSLSLSHSRWVAGRKISYEVFGELKFHELKPHGAHIPVTNDNVAEYIDLYVEWLLSESVAKQFSAFKRGFLKVRGCARARACASRLRRHLALSSTSSHRRRSAVVRRSPSSARRSWSCSCVVIPGWTLRRSSRQPNTKMALTRRATWFGISGRSCTNSTSRNRGPCSNSSRARTARPSTGSRKCRSSSRATGLTRNVSRRRTRASITCCCPRTQHERRCGRSSSWRLTIPRASASGEAALAARGWWYGVVRALNHATPIFSAHC